MRGVADASTVLRMTAYLISFPAAAMAHLTPDELAAASRDTHRIVEDARRAGVWVFGGAVDEATPEVIGVEGALETVSSAGRQDITGGFAILQLPSIDDARSWAGRLAAACRCAQEIRAFHDGAG